jgi:hypothetical protein
VSQRGVVCWPCNGPGAGPLQPLWVASVGGMAARARSRTLPALAGFGCVAPAGWFGRQPIIARPSDCTAQRPP